VNTTQAQAVPALGEDDGLIENVDEWQRNAHRTLRDLGDWREAANLRLNTLENNVGGFNGFRGSTRTEIQGLQDWGQQITPALDGLGDWRTAATGRLEALETWREEADRLLSGFGGFQYQAGRKLRSMKEDIDILGAVHMDANSRVTKLEKSMSAVDARLKKVEIAQEEEERNII